jgi:hypothetical protein
MRPQQVEPLLVSLQDEKEQQMFQLLEKLLNFQHYKKKIIKNKLKASP